MHTGDWKIDPEPLIGGKINSNRLKEIGNEGVFQKKGEWFFSSNDYGTIPFFSGMRIA